MKKNNDLYCVGHRFRPAYDFDYVALDLLSVYPEDSGVYTCHARNAYGEAVSSATIKIFGKFYQVFDKLSTQKYSARFILFSLS